MAIDLEDEGIELWLKMDMNVIYLITVYDPNVHHGCCYNFKIIKKSKLSGSIFKYLKSLITVVTLV